MILSVPGLLQDDQYHRVISIAAKTLEERAELAIHRIQSQTVQDLTSILEFITPFAFALECHELLGTGVSGARDKPKLAIGWIKGFHTQVHCG